jgi:hypothetical protein
MKTVFIGAGVFLIAAATTFAYSSYVVKIPNGDVFGCNSCHKSEKFLTAFKNNGNVWNKALAVKDSDGDRASNGVELQDPEGKWRENSPDPKVPGWNTYNPDDAGSTPPYADVEPLSWGRVKALFR